MLGRCLAEAAGRLSVRFRLRRPTTQAVSPTACAAPTARVTALQPPADRSGPTVAEPMAPEVDRDQCIVPRLRGHWSPAAARRGQTVVDELRTAFQPPGVRAWCSVLRSR